MRIIEKKLNGVLLLEPEVFGDHRGFFMETFNELIFREETGLNIRFIQDNHSLSVETGVLRGLHYQLEPKAQTKLVRVVSGAVFDVAVDIRHGSPTFGQWAGFIISSSNKRQLLIPKGFAHGFCTLVPNTEVVYKVDEFYSKEHDRGLTWNDPFIGINWPTSSPILSTKDAQASLLASVETM